MRRAAALSALVVGLFACRAVVGIRDVSEADESQGRDADADATPPPSSDGSTPAPPALRDAGDANVPDGSVPPITGGAVHYLQNGETIRLAYDVAGGATKELVLSANGAFELDEPATEVRVVTPPAGRRCWLRTASADQVDVRCVLAARAAVEPAQTSSAVFTPVPGGALTVRVDRPTTLLVAFALPAATTSGPEANDLSTLFARAIVDDDPSKSIELRRGSTYWHQPWSQMLLGTIDVAAGDHEIRADFRHTVPNPVAGRTAMIGGTFAGVTFGAELLAVALDSLETYDRTLRAPMTEDFTLLEAEQNTWKEMATLTGSTDGPRKALVYAHYPDIFFASPGSGHAGYFTLQSGAATLLSSTMRHLQDANGYRAVTMVTSTAVSGAFDLRLNQRTELGPNVATLTPGAGLGAVLFADRAKVQTRTFSADGDYGGGAGNWSTVLGTSFRVETTEKALVFLDMNLMQATTNGGAAEVQLVDNGTTPLIQAVVYSWGFQYGQMCVGATLADFSTAGPHTLSVRVRPLNTTVARVLHGVVPDGLGKSAITILPLE